MSPYKVTLSADAIEDLRNIYSYIAFTLKASTTAGKQLNRIRKAIYELDSFPMRYKLVEWEPWASMNVRTFPVDRYEIFYRVEEESSSVTVLHIYYGGRDIEHILQSEN